MPYVNMISLDTFLFFYQRALRSRSFRDGSLFNKGRFATFDTRVRHYARLKQQPLYGLASQLQINYTLAINIYLFD